MSNQICAMCDEAPATTDYGLAVCQPCRDGLVKLEHDLADLEAADPQLAEAARRVEDASRRWLNEHREDQP